MFKKITKNATILGLGTLFSRILGLIRDVLIAKYFGTGSILEVFIVAFRIPNLLRSFLGEGFSDSIATPYLSAHGKDKKRIIELGNNLISVFLFILIIITIMGMFLSRYIIMVIAPGFISDPDKFNLAVSFLRITFPYILFIGLASNLKAILYAWRKFIVPAFLPSFLNISFIIGILFFRNLFHNYILVTCVIFAGLMQVFFYYLFSSYEGFRVKLNFIKAFKDKEIISMFKSAIPRIWSSVIYQLNVFIDTIFSSLNFIVGEGALAAIYYANRIIQFPLALIALSISRVVIVDFSQLHKEGNTKDFKELFIFSFRNIMFFIVPISITLLFVASDTVRILFLRGKFDAYSLAITSSTLFFYLFGLLFFCGIKLLVNVFYSLKDTSTPAKVSTVSLVLNALLSAILMFPLKVGGIALASSIAGAFNFFFLWRILIRRIGDIDMGVFYKDLFRLIFVGLLLGIVTKAIFLLNLNIIVELLLAITVDITLLFVFAYVVGLKQIENLRRWIISLRKR